MVTLFELTSAVQEYVKSNYSYQAVTDFSGTLSTPSIVSIEKDRLNITGPVTIPNLVSTETPRTVVQTATITNSSSSPITKMFSFSESVTDTVSSTFSYGFELGISREFSIGATIELVKLDAKQTISTKFTINSSQTITNAKTRTWVDQYTVPVAANTQATVVYTLSIGKFDGLVDVNLNLSGDLPITLNYTKTPVGSTLDPKPIFKTITPNIGDIFKSANVPGFTVNLDNSVSFKGQLRLQGELGIKSELFVNSNSLITGTTTTTTLNTQTAPKTNLFA